ncbi:DNA helicase [Limnoglobus roseus]|uniref:DNA helicase n=2 Tax=Limnoglobus roseus TaxID=2598579 RepID=A0A5C1AB15_9BACT|nr:DNA helicase [Limnoglobus roseus]
MWRIGNDDLANVQFGPNRVLLLGDEPGAGKTAFVMQAVYDALRLNKNLRAVVCNVEMVPNVLWLRLLSRHSELQLTVILRRTFTEEQRVKVRTAVDEMEPALRRLTFVPSPFTLSNVVATANALGAELIVLDYIQRMAGSSDDRRAGGDALMDGVRAMANAGCGVIVVAAVGRSKDTKGRNSYSQLSLASFRESSELEYGADDAYILSPGEQANDPHTLRHLKSRYGECRDIPLTFSRAIRRFRSSAIEGKR